LNSRILISTLIRTERMEDWDELKNSHDLDNILHNDQQKNKLAIPITACELNPSGMRIQAKHYVQA
jgi:hypothetical protein